MKTNMSYTQLIFVILLSCLSMNSQAEPNSIVDHRPRVIVTTDGEADDRCSMIRFLLSSNELQVEAIVNSSSQFHWSGGEGWNALHPVIWVEKQIGLYAKVYDNLVLHDPNFPSPDYLLSRLKVGNISGIGEYQERTKGAEFIAEILLDGTDPRPVWVLAWGGCNTIARALKIIQEDHPEKMQRVADKLRLFLIWEQDESYQQYIRPNWEALGTTTIISDQFDCMAYIWKKVLPENIQLRFHADWMSENILRNHGPLCSSYEGLDYEFQAEGDTPAFLHTIPNGLRSIESPGFGGWGGRYVHVRNNVWMDPPPSVGWKHAEGQRSIHNSWSKQLEHATEPRVVEMRTAYFKPTWRWLPAVQNEFAARADWCVKDYASANHHPVIRLRDTPQQIDAAHGVRVILDAQPTTDPDGDHLRFRWWHYAEAGTYAGKAISETNSPRTAIRIPKDAESGDEIHIICEVTDSGTPSLTRYQRIVIRVVDRDVK